MSCKTPKDPSRYNSLKLYCCERYGLVVGTFLANRISKMIVKSGDFCISHLRIADTEKYTEVKEYFKIKESGCCSSCDKILEYKPNGINGVIFNGILNKTYMVGFNYGH